jgi:DNA-directed RNA polymerase subunit RPC12/RpoP
MGSSDFRCLGCKRLLGTVQGNVLRHALEVSVRNYLIKGYAELKCPACGKTRLYHGGIVEVRLAKAS